MGSPGDSGSRLRRLQRLQLSQGSIPTSAIFGGWNWGTKERSCDRGEPKVVDRRHVAVERANRQGARGGIGSADSREFLGP